MTPGAVQTTKGVVTPVTSPLPPPCIGNANGFLTKLDSSGSSLVYSTYLGGNSQGNARGVAIDSAGDADVVGWTESSDFPPGAGTTGLVFVVKVDPTGSRFVYALRFGGHSSLSPHFGDDDPSGGAATGTSEEGRGIVAVGTGFASAAWVTGFTDAPDFPTGSRLATHPAQQTHAASDAFAALIGECTIPGICP